MTQKTTQMPGQHNDGTRLGRRAMVALAVAGAVLAAGPARGAPPRTSWAPTAAELEVVDRGASGKPQTARFAVALGAAGQPARIEVHAENATYELAFRHRANPDGTTLVEVDLRRSVTEVVAAGRRSTSSARLLASRTLRGGERVAVGSFAVGPGLRTEVALTVR